MHATYAFLISVPSCFSLKGKAEHAAKVFENDYASSDHTDENNWYEICGIICEDGESFNLLNGKEHYRSRDSIISEFIKSSPEETWNGLIDFSHQTAKNELIWKLGLYKKDGTVGNPPPICKKDLAAYLDAHIVETIQSNKVWWMDGVDIETKSNGDEQVAKMLQEEVSNHIHRTRLIRDCILSSRFGLFSRTMATPYDYRCFDLRDAAETEDTQDVVLLVDIHT